MKHSSSILIITSIYAALTVGYVPRRQRHCQLLLKHRPPIFSGSITSSEINNLLHTMSNVREQYFESHFNDAHIDEDKKPTNKVDMLQLWRKGRRMLATFAMVPLLLGGTATV